jgi:hypothetical protein
VTRQDPTRRFLRALSRELRWRPLIRRRLVGELAQHLEDSMAHLRSTGMSSDEAIREALRRLGDAESVAGSAKCMGARPRWDRGVRRLRSPAWVAVGAMSLVTAWAAELPQASGAKTTTSSVPAAIRHSARLGQLQSGGRPSRHKSPRWRPAGRS